MTRSQRRDAAVRAGLVPMRPGERPTAIVVASVVAALLGLGNLVAYLAGVKIGGRHPAAGGIILFSLLMLVCAVGMWRLWYGAVLGFMALLAIVTSLFALLLIEASNLLGVVVGVGRDPRRPGGCSSSSCGCSAASRCRGHPGAERPRCTRRSTGGEIGSLACPKAPMTAS